jgi:hypothetical protein
MVAYENSPEVVKFHLPGAHQFLPPFQKSSHDLRGRRHHERRRRRDPAAQGGRLPRQLLGAQHGEGEEYLERPAWRLSRRQLVMAEPGQVIEADDYADEWFKKASGKAAADDDGGEKALADMNKPSCWLSRRRRRGRGRLHQSPDRGSDRKGAGSRLTSSCWEPAKEGPLLTGRPFAFAALQAPTAQQYLRCMAYVVPQLPTSRFAILHSPRSTTTCYLLDHRRAAVRRYQPGPRPTMPSA